MSERIKIEIDDAQLRTMISKLQGVTGVTGGATTSVGGAPASSVSAARTQYAGGLLQSQPGGFLPSIPRGIRTTMGMVPGGYDFVATYQKGLWLEQGIGSVMDKGLTMAGLLELYTFAILMIIDVKNMLDNIRENMIQNTENIRSMSDINSGVAFKEWKKVQDNPYRSRGST
jgi:hypothetical protein